MEGDGTMPKVFPMPPSTPGQTQATAAQQDAADFLHPDDAQKRDSHLKRLMRGKWDKIAATPLGIMCLPYLPEIGEMLCMPREQVQERLHNMLSSLSMVFALVFSGVAGSALSPLPVEEWGEGTGKRAVANFFNMAASIQFIICAAGTLFTSFLMMFINAQHDSNVFRVLVKINSLMTYPYLIFYSSLLLLAQLFANIYLQCDEACAWAIIGGGTLIFWILLNH